MDFPECTCEWMQVWHHTAPNGAMQERNPVLSEYRADCPVPAHTALARLIGAQGHQDAAERRAAAHE